MDRAHRTLLTLGWVFTGLGTLLLGLAAAQLLFWWNGQWSGLTIEPILLPVGLIFLVAGLPKLVRARRHAWLQAEGRVAPAEVVNVATTREVIDRHIPVVVLVLAVRPPGEAPFAARVRWPLGPGAARLVPGARVQVRYRPGRPSWVEPA